MTLALAVLVLLACGGLGPEPAATADPPACAPGECPAAPLYPSWICADGSLGGRGACVRDAAGVCGWLRKACEPAASRSGATLEGTSGTPDASQSGAAETGDEAHPCLRIDPAVARSWPVRALCDSLGRYPRRLVSLSDGTSLYVDPADPESGCFRGRIERPCRKK